MRAVLRFVRPAVPPATGLLIDPSAGAQSRRLGDRGWSVRHRLLPVWASPAQASHRCTGIDPFRSNLHYLGELRVNCTACQEFLIAKIEI